LLRSPASERSERERPPPPTQKPPSTAYVAGEAERTGSGV